MRAAIAHVAPSRQDLVTLVAALGKLRPDGRLGPGAIDEIGRLRLRFRSAHAEVARLTRPTALRANLLAFLAGVDGRLEILAALGQTTDPKRGAILLHRAAQLDRQ